MDWKSEIQENVRSGLLELMVLKLLTIEDMYGYQIKQELYKRTDGAYQVKEGTLYGPIYRLAQKNLITSNRVIVKEKRVRNYYHIEKAGLEYLRYGEEEMKAVFGGLIHLFGFDFNEAGSNSDEGNEQVSKTGKDRAKLFAVD